MIKLKPEVAFQAYKSYDDITKTDLKKLSSVKGLHWLLRKKTIDLKRVNRVLELLYYEEKIKKLQIRLLKAQQVIIEKGLRVMVIFEGRDAAGKEGAIHRLTEHLNPRHTNIVALKKPNPDERKSWFFQRYVERFAKPTEMVFFDRSWYNRAIVEPAMGFCTIEEYQRFIKEVPDFENMIINDGILFVKFYFSISKEEQIRRLNEVQTGRLKRWKYSQVDSVALEMWEEYSYYKEQMFVQTSFQHNPWVVVQANSKTSARLTSLHYLLKKIENFIQ